MQIIIEYIYLQTLDNVDELGSVGVRRQVKAVLLNGVANNGDTGALELLVVGVP